MRFRLFIIVFGFLLTSCGGGPQAPRVSDEGKAAAEAPQSLEVSSLPQQTVQTLRVAVLLPLSGPQAALGQALLQAAQMALFDIGNPAIVLMPRDVGSTAENATAAAQDAVNAGAQIILGPVFSQSVQAAGAVARRAHVPLVGFSNDRVVAGNGVFLTGFTPDEEIRRVVSYAASKGYMRMAALIPETAYGDAAAAAFRSAVPAAGASLDRMVTYPPDGDRLHAPVRQLASYDERHKALQTELDDLKNFGDDDLARADYDRLKSQDTIGTLSFDALLIPDGGELLRALSPLLPYYDVDPGKVKFLGTSLWEDETLTREPPLAGGWFAAPPTAERDRFEARYRTVYGAQPPGIAALAYDGVALAATLGLPQLEQLKGQPIGEESLLNVNGFRGVDGIFRFRSNGLAERGLDVKTITPQGIRVIDPAPSSFQGAGS